MPSGDDLTDLIISAQAGDQRTWDALVERYTPFVWSVARGHGLSAASAADVVQTAWLRLVESLPQVSGDTVGTWLARTARTEAVQALLWSDPRIERRPRTGSGGDGIWDAVDALPARTRLALRVLAADPAPSDAEIASALDIDPADVAEVAASSLRRLAESIPTHSTI